MKARIPSLIASVLLAAATPGLPQPTTIRDAYVELQFKAASGGPRCGARARSNPMFVNPDTDWAVRWLIDDFCAAEKHTIRVEVPPSHSPFLGTCILEWKEGNYTYAPLCIIRPGAAEDYYPYTVRIDGVEFDPQIIVRRERTVALVLRLDPKDGCKVPAPGPDQWSFEVPAAGAEHLLLRVINGCATRSEVEFALPASIVEPGCSGVLAVEAGSEAAASCTIGKKVKPGIYKYGVKLH
jgi:hypothetical protein